MANGSLGEAKVLAYLMQKGYTVYTQFDGKGPFDLIAWKDKEGLRRVSIKSTSSKNKNGSWDVQLKTVRHNKTRNKITNFDPVSCDILAVYIEPEDRVILLNPSEIKQKSAMRVNALKA